MTTGELIEAGPLRVWVREQIWGGDTMVYRVSKQSQTGVGVAYTVRRDFLCELIVNMEFPHPHGLTSACKLLGRADTLDDAKAYCERLASGFASGTLGAEVTR